MSDDYLSKAEPATHIEKFDEQSQTTIKKQIRYSAHEMVSGISGDSSCITKSDPTTDDDAKDIVLKPQDLKKQILDQSITAITTPFLLCFTGLPDSKKSTALNKLLQHFNKDTSTHKMEEFNEHGIRFFELAAARRPPDNEITYEKVKSLVGTSNGYALVVQSAIDHLYGVRGQFIKDFHDPSNVESERVYFDDDPDLNQHFLFILGRLSALNRKKKETDNVPIWSQSLPSGISMINIWDIGLNKAVLYILPFLSGLLYNCHAWLFFDLLRDLPQLYELPDLPVNKYDPSRNDREYVMRWRARIHYLLRYAKLTESNPPRQKTCKLIASCTKTIESKILEKKIEAFRKEAKNVAMQMQLFDFIDVDKITSFDQDNENHLQCLTEMFDEIVHNQFKSPVKMPLSFVFLRSFFCEKDELYISKDVLKQKALALQLNDAMFTEFCRLFTSFGSIIDVSLIDSLSDLIILKPDVFFHELDKLFYPSPDVDSLVTTYGIVSESTATSIFGSKKLSSVFMSFLTSIGLALKLESKVFNITLSDQFAYYIPNVCTAKPILECEPTALHLLRDLNIPMSNFKLKFTDFFLNEYKSTILEMPKEPHINVSSFRAFPSNIPDHNGVIFELVYLGDAIEFRILTPYDHSCIEEICIQIISVCHKIMPQKVKYNFAVMCSDDPNPKAIYKLRRNHHFLPNEDLCTKCKSKGRLESGIIKIWNAVLSKDPYKVPRNQLLNGNPLTFDDTVSLAKEMSDLSPQSLSYIAKHLFEDVFLTQPITEKLCLKTVLAWEGLTNEESSKRDLAIKLMNVANEIYESNQEESKLLEAIARSLNFRVARSMSISEKKN